MRERPILFQGDMIRALLAGMKTQTRRAVKPQPDFDTARAALGRHVGDERAGYDHLFHSIGLRDGGAWGFVQPNIRSPYGGPGDRLWVREAFRTYAGYDGESMKEMQQRLSCTDDEMTRVAPIVFEADGVTRNWLAAGAAPGRYRHARFMPRWASRITLEITEVRVERLQAITSADCFAEGIDTEGDDFNEGEHYEIAGGIPAERWAYARLWERINGRDPAKCWDANPWVWVVSFRRIEQPMQGDTR